MGLGIKIPKNVFAKAREDYKSNPGGQMEDVQLEPGRHVCIVIGARGVEAKGTPKFVIDLKVAGESEQAGGRCSLWFELTEERTVHLLRCLTKLGYDVSDIDENGLSEIAEDLKKEKPVVRVTAKQNGEYVNAYLDKKLDDVTAAEVDVPTRPAQEEEDAGKDKKDEEPEAEAEAEPEAETEGEDDGLDAMDRNDLKKKLKELDPAFTVLKKHTDDDLRTVIREKIEAAKDAGNENGEEAEEEGDPSGAEESVELEVGMQVKCVVKGKDVIGKVVAIDENSGIVKVKDKAGTVHKAPADTVELP